LAAVVAAVVVAAVALGSGSELGAQPDQTDGGRCLCSAQVSKRTLEWHLRREIQFLLLLRPRPRLISPTERPPSAFRAAPPSLAQPQRRNELAR